MKKSAAAVEQNQIARMVDSSDSKHINLQGKKAVVYIQEPYASLAPREKEIIDYARENGVLVVTDISDLIKELRWKSLAIVKESNALAKAKLF